jgi:hypothetical protein
MPRMHDERTAAATAVFQKDLGTWDAATVVRFPGQPDSHSTGVSENRLVAGRWLVVDYRASSGFEGHGVYGWDPDRGCYVGTWVDTMMASPARAEGEWDEASRTMRYRVTTTSQGRPFAYREETREIEPGHLVYRSWIPMPDGSEHQLMEVVYRRRSG